MKDIILPIFFVLLWAKNAYCLKFALQFLHDVKANAYVECWAKIIWAFSTSGGTYFSRKYAKAVYTVDGKQIHSKMICACDFRIDKGNILTVIFPESNPKIFALSKQHVKNAVLTYGVLTAVFAFCSIGMTIIYLLAFFE
ncbi:MAG: hypothetical protein K2N49_05515 [Ruminococcus sp.]|nr:hypothetical protein [Ruminococcus sp.]MDE7226300.1 hypothetical protein [Ruminococcus sp.]